MKINVEGLQKNATPNSKLAGITSIVLNDSFVVENIRIVNGTKGVFVAMPARQINSGSFKDIAFPATKELSNQIIKNVVDAFNTGKYDPGELGEMHVTSVKIMRLENSENSIKAVASISLNNEFIVSDIRIIEESEKEKKYNIYMPTWKKGDSWRNLAYSIDKKLTDEIMNCILNEYKNNI